MWVSQDFCLNVGFPLRESLINFLRSSVKNLSQNVKRVRTDLEHFSFQKTMEIRNERLARKCFTRKQNTRTVM